MRLMIAIAIVFLTILLLTGLLYRPARVGPDFIDPVRIETNPVCSERAVQCVTDGDCDRCQDGNVFEIRCQDHMGRRYCLPKKPDQPCNMDHGGQWMWTGWADSKNRDWECLCAYPEIAGNKGCTEINPNVCRGGTFTFPKNSKRGPRPEDCECPPSTFRIVTEGNVPMCIKRNKTSCFDEDTCRQFYSSL